MPQHVSNNTNKGNNSNNTCGCQTKNKNRNCASNDRKIIMQLPDREWCRCADDGICCAVPAILRLLSVHVFLAATRFALCAARCWASNSKMTSLSQSMRSIDAKWVPNYGWRWRVQVIAEKPGLGKCVGEKNCERPKNASAASGEKLRVMMTIPHSLTWKFATLQKNWRKSGAIRLEGGLRRRLQPLVKCYTR